MKFLTFILLFVLCINCFAQNEKVSLYSPEADAKLEIQQAVEKAANTNKHVLVQIGGNWCSWCVKLHNFCIESSKIDSTLKADYIIVKLNYSKENRNKEILQELEFPQRFGFPVFVVLDGKGKRIHTQNTVYLEEGKGYNEKRILDFLKSWNYAALSPSNYE